MTKTINKPALRELAENAKALADISRYESMTALTEFEAAVTPDAVLTLLDELDARKLTLPPLNDDLIAILGRPNFTCSHLAELMRKSGDDIRRKSEHEQAAVIHWFLGLYLEHGENWEGVAKADIQSRVAVATAGIKGE
ncbi:MAG: hypothetical protein WAK61_08550 [Leclercia sp.]